MTLLESFPEIKNYIGQGKNPGFFYQIQKIDDFLDRKFGIQYIKDIENKAENIYSGIEKEALLTSYLDYHQILESIERGETLIDIGAGYCRGSFLSEEYDYGVKCISIECSEQRAYTAKRKLQNRVIIKNILDEEFHLIEAKNYFIYLPWGTLVEKILKEIFLLNKKCSIYLIESHGNLIASFNLYSKYFKRDSLFFSKTSTPRHDEFIYRYNFLPSQDFSELERNSSWEEDFLLWFLKYKNHYSSILVSSPIASREDRHEWKSSINGAFVAEYLGRISLFLPEKNRYLVFPEDKILKFI